jgi:crossover junction endodeoxyribonuclease RusA
MREVDVQGPWEIRLPPGEELLTLNDRPHWAVRNRITGQLRGDAANLCRLAKIPKLERATVTVVLHPHDRRRRDPHNWAPSAKACIDGIVDSGVLEDDHAAHLLGVTFVLGTPVRHGQLSLIIHRVDPA